MSICLHYETKKFQAPVEVTKLAANPFNILRNAHLLEEVSNIIAVDKVIFLSKERQ